MTWYGVLRSFPSSQACSPNRVQYNAVHTSPLHTMSNVQLLNAIRRLRFDRSMTQEELALRTGVSRQTIMSIERGRTNPSILLALKIASALGVDVEEVFTMEGKLAPV